MGTTQQSTRSQDAKGIIGGRYTASRCGDTGGDTNGTKRTHQPLSTPVRRSANGTWVEVTGGGVVHCVAARHAEDLGSILRRVIWVEVNGLDQSHGVRARSMSPLGRHCHHHSKLSHQQTFTGCWRRRLLHRRVIQWKVRFDLYPWSS